jgi:DNA replication protein DnaC
MCSCEKAAKEEKQRREKELARINRIKELRMNSMLGKHTEWITFDRFEVTKDNKGYFNMAKKYCENWQHVKKENIGMIFYGKPGRGKTFLATAIANELLSQLVTVIMVRPSGILSRLKETYQNYGRESDYQIINQLQNASLLIIDDLGSERATDWGREKIYEIIDARYTAGLPLIVTTNLSPENLKKAMTSADGVGRTYDRLMGMCTKVEIDGPARRQDESVQKAEIFRSIIRGDYE